jgi:hypothetical protein
LASMPFSFSTSSAGRAKRYPIPDGVGVEVRRLAPIPR